MKIKPHPLVRSTELPSSIYKRRDWELLGFYRDYLALGHYISHMFGDVYYLVLKSGYGTINEALVDNQREITSTDDNEYEIDTMSVKVRENFRVADILSPAQRLGIYDVVVSTNMIDLNDEDLSLFVDFTERHRPTHVFLLFHSPIDQKRWIEFFERYGFTFESDVVRLVQNDLFGKLNVVKLDSLLIFKKERKNAWRREDA